MPTDRGVRGVAEYLLDNLVNEACVKQAMCELASMTRSLEGEGLDTNSKRVVAKAMKDYIIEWDIQMWGCQIFENLVIRGKQRVSSYDVNSHVTKCFFYLYEADSTDIIYSPEIVALVPMLMRQHLDQPEVQIAAANFLTSVSAQGMTSQYALQQTFISCLICGTVGVSDHASQVIASCEGIKDVLAAMRYYPTHVAVQAACCNALWSLLINGRSNITRESFLIRLKLVFSTTDDNVRVMTEQAGVFDVINTLKSLRGAAEVMESASAAIIAISVEGLSQFSCRVRSVT